MRNLIYTAHARSRMKIRGISDLEVEEVLQRAKPIGWRDGKQLYLYNKIGVVVDDRDENVMTVITAYHSTHSLSKLIDNIPPDKTWWKQDSREIFINHAYYLIENGFTQQEAIDFLTDSYNAVSEEYGN